MKANPWKLIQAHYRTLRDARTDEDRWQDYALFLGVPTLVYVGCIVIEVQLPTEASAGLLTATGVLAAFFFGVVLQIAQRSMDLATEAPPLDKAMVWQIEFLRQIAANAGYACLVSVAGAVVFLAALVSTAPLLAVIFSSLGLAIAIHLALLLSMVLSRVYDLISRRLTTAQVGGAKGTGTVHPIDSRRSGSGQR
ncbi:MAG TPA: hypothetical protein VHF50_02220 [Solirubrobacterales bacterium]|nr:hypothetical protein [Solirubrobacterales bacterium]